MQCWDLSSIISGIVLVVLDLLDCCMCGRVYVRGEIYIGVAERREIRAEGGLFRLNVLRAWRMSTIFLFIFKLYKIDFIIDIFFQSMYRVYTGSEAHDDDVLHN